MLDCFHLDYETRSLCDIKRTGAFKYAEDPSTEILCAAIARNDEEPLLWVNPKFAFDDLFTCRSSPGADELMREMCASTGPVYAHNAQFEHAITNHCPNSPFKVDIRRWRCTAAMSRRAAIPSSLEKAAETLGLLQQKDSKGKTLIRKFSVPQKKDGKFIEPIQKQEDFIAFCEYCLQDVRVEQGIHKALKHFELTGDILEAFLADLAINARGMPVNIPALRHAKSLIDAYEARLTEEFRGLTGFNPTQRDVLLKWLKENGYPGDNLRADTLDEQLGSAEFDPSSLLGRVLTIKKHLSFASIKKVGAMIECACEDGRVRGTLQFYGASTGRASGRLIQPQNFKRPTIADTDASYADICAGEGEDHIELFHGPLLEVIGSSIRHFIHDPEGPIFDVDFSAIEARVSAWLAGEEWKLEVFRTHGKIYEATICRMTGMPLQEMLDYAKEHGKHHPDRFKGKVSELALTYQGGKNALIAMGAIDMGLKEEELEGIVEQWREANSNIVKLWHMCDRAAKNAVTNFGTRYEVGKLSFFCATTAGARYLFMKLPSGRRISYRDPKIDETVSRDKKTGEIETWSNGNIKTRQTLSYWGQIPGKVAWGRCAIYGGMWVENCLAGDTQVLTDSGFKRLDAVQESDLLWDGEQFVKHQGLMDRGVQDTMEFQGIRCTPDHQFLTGKGFMEAKSLCNCGFMVDTLSDECSSCKKQKASRFDGETLRPFGGGSVARHGRAQGVVGSEVPVRQHHSESRDRDFQEEPSPGGVFQKMPFDESHLVREKNCPRDVETSRPRSMVVDDTEVCQPKARSLSQLRRAWHRSVRRMADKLCSVLGGHGIDIPARAGHRPQRQQRRILQGELPMGYADSQHAELSEERNSGGNHRPCSAERDQIEHSDMENSQRGEAGGGLREDSRSPQQVYDIRNCGPRNRFAVRGAGGFLVIAHNCSQAIAADLLNNGIVKAEKKGIHVASMIHDQCLAYKRGDFTIQDLCDCLTDLPAWAEGLPIAVDGQVQPYYTK